MGITGACFYIIRFIKFKSYLYVHLVGTNGPQMMLQHIDITFI